MFIIKFFIWISFLFFYGVGCQILQFEMCNMYSFFQLDLVFGIYKVLSFVY